MGKPNYQRILAAHGRLPDQLMEDFGLKILDQKVDSTATAVTIPKTLPIIEKSKNVKSIDEEYVDLIDENGRKFIEYSWIELRAKASKDGIFQQGFKRADILKEYAKK